METTDERLAVMLAISMVPGALVGVALEKVIEENLGQPWLIAVMLIVFAVVLYIADRSPQRLQFEDFRVKQALVMGVAQAVALQPGVSRAGVTISAGRFMGIERAAVARISFLMSLPIIGGAAAYKGLKLASDGFPPGTVPAFAWGFIASAATGVLAIYIVFRVIKATSYTPFVIYRIALGVAILGVIASGFRAGT
jgi:undecaprenyl-diphosphatase